MVMVFYKIGNFKKMTWEDYRKEKHFNGNLISTYIPIN